ncbi:GspH/FimT family pseudopilin [Methylocucumis oryzae]|uniref:GspH/FimT family pseudopilin n=1 Tax=Methylocucumis oryzae TaxID=1632867 RepID=UPI000695C1D2|nr:GspH/FimT family pseudopilin [Methylocucumis oryzae]
MVNNRIAQNGFTLIELLMTLAIASVVAAIGLPSLTEMYNKNRLTAYTNQLVSDLNLARSEAVKRGLPVALRNFTGGGVWEDGWIVFADVSRNGVNANVFNDDGDEILCEPQEDCVLRKTDALPQGFILGANSKYTNFVRYDPDGTSNTNGTFAVCDNQDGSGQLSYKSKLIIINTMGRIRLGVDQIPLNHPNGIPEFDDNSELSDCSDAS